GGMLIISDEHIAKKLVKDIFESVKRKGADCIATACPLCQMNLEAYQGKVNAAFGTDYNIPVVPFTQLLGLSLGVPPQELEFDRNIIKSKKILETV
ncbi:MAG: heterodisulfide reductase-related iron-sulfur binding cluster, partial [Armatimonadota bacterium]